MHVSGKFQSEDRISSRKGYDSFFLNLLLNQ